MRRAACAIICSIGEERTATTQWLQASKSIHESTQVEIYRAMGFPATASRPLPSRIFYRYSDLESPRVSTIGELGRHAFGNPGHQWYCSSPLHGTSSNTQGE